MFPSLLCNPTLPINGEVEHANVNNPPLLQALGFVGFETEQLVNVQGKQTKFGGFA